MTKIVLEIEWEAVREAANRPPGVEPAVQFDSTRENSAGQVAVSFCLVHPVNDRVFSLLNSGKLDCSLIPANCPIYSVAVSDFIFVFSRAISVF